MDRIDAPLKAFFLFMGLFLWVAIWLTGFDMVHWLFYIPATFFLFSAITGICPGIIFFKEMFRDKKTDQ